VRRAHQGRDREVEQSRPRREHPRQLNDALTRLRIIPAQKRAPTMKAIVLGLAALLIAGPSIAQTSDYPNRPVKMVAPFAPGGPVDVVARVLAPKLSEGLGQQFYVENHPGGSGNIGTALVAKASPDGYTVLVISSTLVVNPSLFSKLGFDTTTDLAPVSLV